MFEQAFHNIDDLLRKEAGCLTELDYNTALLFFEKGAPTRRRFYRRSPRWLRRARRRWAAFEA